MFDSAKILQFRVQMLQQPAQVSALSFPLIFRTKPIKKDASTNQLLDQCTLSGHFVHRWHSMGFYSCKSYNTAPTGSVITIKMYACGCLKSHFLLFSSSLKHHETETA